MSRPSVTQAVLLLAAAATVVWLVVSFVRGKNPVGFIPSPLSSGFLDLQPNIACGSFPTATLGLSPGSVSGGTSSTATITLSAAYCRRIVAHLTSSSSSIGRVSSYVVIPSGATTKTYKVATNVVGSSTNVTLTATELSSTASSVLAVTGGSSCNKYAALTGSDSNTGTLASPYRTVQKVVDNLTAGQTGCLGGGTYTESTINWNSGGSVGSRETLQSTPGERATIHTRLVISDATNYVTVHDITFDGSGQVVAITILGDNVTFEHDDISTHHTGTGAPQTAICVIVGDTNGLGYAANFLFNGNRVHDCGNLPSDNRGHGLYNEGTSNATYTNNYFYDNTDRGIQNYPDGDGSLISHNVFDNNGENILFGGIGSLHSDNITVSDNVITNANLRANVESFYSPGDPVGTGNTVTSNCVWSASNGLANIDTSLGGFTVSSTTTANPLYTNAAAHDYTLQAGSPCAGDGPTEVVP